MFDGLMVQVRMASGRFPQRVKGGGRQTFGGIACPRELGVDGLEGLWLLVIVLFLFSYELEFKFLGGITLDDCEISRTSFDPHL